MPAAVYNNRKGADEKILERFDEPAWNNPVIRFLDKTGKDIVPRRDRIWTSGDVAARLAEVLAAAGREIPTYLRNAVRELYPEKPAMATFAMHCFWEGEVRLGELEGVITTRAGWVDRLEVVEVVFDENLIDYGTLLEKAAALECATRVFAHDSNQEESAVALAEGRVSTLDSPARDAKPSDDKYRLKATHLRYLPLTPMQATKVNAALGRGADPAPWLSPRQKTLAARIDAAIKLDADALKHLAPPRSVEELPAYEEALLKTLAAGR